MNDKRNQLQLDGKRLFADMDNRNMGFISVHNFAGWVADNCGFHIVDEDLPALEQSLDGANYYRITKAAFIETVSVKNEDEQAQEEELLEAFKAMDTNGNGVISPDELREVMAKEGMQMSEEEIE